MHIALHIDRGLLRVESTSQIFGEDGFHALADMFGARMGGD